MINQHLQDAIAELQEFIALRPEAREVRKALAVKLVYQGYLYEEIQTILDVSLGSITLQAWYHTLLFFSDRRTFRSTDIGFRIVCAAGMSLHRKSCQVGICRECNRRVQPTPVMSVTISEYKTGLGSLVGANRTVAQPYKLLAS